MDFPPFESRMTWCSSPRAPGPRRSWVLLCRHRLLLPIFHCVQSAPLASFAPQEEVLRPKLPAAHGGLVRNGLASPLASILHRLRCPACGGKIRCESESCACLNPACRRLFAVIDGVPLLLDEKSSVFQLHDPQRGRNPFSSRPSGSAKLRATRALPTISKNIRARQNYLRFADLLEKGSAKTHVLVIGGATVGAGLESILSLPSINFVESDVCLSERTALVCGRSRYPL